MEVAEKGGKKDYFLATFQAVISISRNHKLLKYLQ